jgi:hypothetical protein
MIGPLRRLRRIRRRDHQMDALAELRIKLPTTPTIN